MTVLAESTIARTWELRRQAENAPAWRRPLLGVLVAAAFIVIANPDLLPGGAPVALAGLILVVAVTVVSVVVGIRRASFRGHAGSVEAPDEPGRKWWRSPAMAGPAVFTLIFVGRMTGVFDHWPVIIGCAVVAGVAFALILPRYETADHITGPRLERLPSLSADGEVAVTDGELTPEVLELLVLQHHTGERRVSWCADVLGTDLTDIRERIARGRRWFELPATEAHRPKSADWVRLFTAGREVLGYV